MRKIGNVYGVCYEIFAAGLMPPPLFSGTLDCGIAREILKEGLVIAIKLQLTISYHQGLCWGVSGLQDANKKGLRCRFCRREPRKPFCRSRNMWGGMEDPIRHHPPRKTSIRAFVVESMWICQHTMLIIMMSLIPCLAG